MFIKTLTLPDLGIGQPDAEFLVLAQACRAKSHARRRSETEEDFFQESKDEEEEAFREMERRNGSRKV